MCCLAYYFSYGHLLFVPEDYNQTVFSLGTGELHRFGFLFALCKSRISWKYSLHEFSRNYLQSFYRYFGVKIQKTNLLSILLLFEFLKLEAPKFKSLSSASWPRKNSNFFEWPMQLRSVTIAIKKPPKNHEFSRQNTSRIIVCYILILNNWICWRYLTFI